MKSREGLNSNDCRFNITMFIFYTMSQLWLCPTFVSAEVFRIAVKQFEQIPLAY